MYIDNLFIHLLIHVSITSSLIITNKAAISIHIRNIIVYIFKYFLE